MIKYPIGYFVLLVLENALGKVPWWGNWAGLDGYAHEWPL